MGAPISDKIRKIHDPNQTVRSGPGHAGFYIDSNDNLMVNINAEDGPQQVGADLAGAVLSVLRRVAQGNVSFYGDDENAITIDAPNLCVWFGAYRDKDSNDLIATRVTVIQVGLQEDTDGIFAVTTYVDQVAGELVDTNNVGKAFAFDSTAIYYGDDKVEHGTPKTFVVDGDSAGPIAVTGLLPNSLLISVIEFDSGVPADLTSEFSISDEDEIDNTGGTDTTGNKLIVSVLLRA